MKLSYKECARDKPNDHTATGKVYGAKAWTIGRFLKPIVVDGLVFLPSLTLPDIVLTNFERSGQ